MEKWYRFCQIAGKIIAFVWIHEVEGTVPEKGATVIVSNHKSYFDSPLLGIFLNRRVWFLAKKRVFKWFIIGWLVKKSNWALPVSKGSVSSIRTVDELLKQGGAIVLFPEGTRNKTNHVLTNFERSFAKLAIANNASVVPIAIVRKYKRFWWLPGGIKIKITESIPAENLTEQQIAEFTWQKIYSCLSQG